MSIKSIRKILVFSIILTVGLYGFSLADVLTPQPKDKPKNSYICKWTNTPPIIDGKPTDACWDNAIAIDNFHLPWLQEKDRPSLTKTKAKLLWDRDNFYYLAQMEDHDLFADVVEHDGKTWDNDVFEIFIKPSNKHSGYYEFQVNAANTFFDCFFPKKRELTENFADIVKADKFHMEAKVVLDGTLNKRDDRDKGWTVEGRIPWADFAKTGGRPNIDETWNFALCRYDYNIKEKGPELSTSAPLKSKTHADFHLFQDYAPMVFEGPIAPASTLGRVPAKNMKVVGSPEPPLPYKTVNAFPKLKLKNLTCILPVPDSNLMLASSMDRPYAPSSIVRFDSREDVAESLTLLESKDTIFDMLFHPDYKKNGYLYLGCNGPGPEAKKHTRVVRYTISNKSPFTIDPKSAVTIKEWHSDGHNGAALAFGKDGMLYVTSGDGTSDSDTWVSGQDMTRPLGKVLRLDVDHPDEGKQYSIPKDNPFLHIKDAVPETWAYGLRNPWRMHCDKKTGHLWVGNNGQDLWEQVYFIRKGDNYGWSVMEGSHPFYSLRKPGPTPFVKPIAEHHHSEARSLTGGIVYYGSKFPELQGCYIYGDHSTGKIWGIRHDGEKVTWHKEIADTSLQITGFGEDNDGNLLVVDLLGIIHKFIPVPKDLPQPHFPKKLSESGLFQSIRSHEMVEGVIPYSVNAPFWSDQAFKARFIALPEFDSEGKPTFIDYSNTKSWTFPNGTVIVKSFALEMEHGNPQSKEWIETRFMTRQEGEWAGYSYLWNKEQTDADLVESAGRDVSFQIADKGEKEGTRKQVWHYPSRAECMVCHSRASNFVLGLCEVQMNKSHDYKTGSENQLNHLEQLRILKPRSSDLKESLKRIGQADGKKDKELDEWVNTQLSFPDQRKPATPDYLLPLPVSQLKKLVNPYDKTNSLEARVKSYLHSNCANCHINAGGGNSQMDLDFFADKDKIKILDEKPNHHTFGFKDAKIIAPGDPERSVLLHRISIVGTGQMPQISRNMVDKQAVELFTEWIRSLPK